MPRALPNVKEIAARVKQLAVTSEATKVASAAPLAPSTEFSIKLHTLAAELEKAASIDTVTVEEVVVFARGLMVKQ